VGDTIGQRDVAETLVDAIELDEVEGTGQRTV